MNGEESVLGRRYRLLRLIGRGGMGEVYEAEHVETGRRVAVKLLRPRLAEREEHRRRFEREARAAGRIEHANVCEVLDFGTDDDGTLFLVMPLLHGEPLTDLIAREAPLPFGLARDVAGQVLDALAVAHDAGLIHRDLKPDNLFLASGADGRAQVVKVLDFGISRVETGDDDAKTLTRTGAVLGTPYYMAPEQAQGIKDLDARVDLYAAGVVLYEMVTGTKPIDGASAPELFWKLWNVPVTPPRALRSDIPPALEALILKALSRNREERFPSARAMGEALASAVPPGATGERARPARVVSPVVLSRLSSWPDTLRLPDATPAPEAETITAAEAPATPAPRAAAPRPGGRRRRAWVGPVATAAAIVAMAAAGVWVAAGERGAASPPRAAAVAPQPGPLPQGIPPRNSGTTPRSKSRSPRERTGEGPAAPSDRLVRFELVGVPEGAAVAVDGQRVEGSAFEVPRSRGAATLVVESSGHRPWSTRLDLTTAAAGANVVRVDLLPDERAATRVSRHVAPRPQGHGVQPIVGGFGEIP
jgi:eukaryotic-like serine/threonine-protein kinase